MRQAKKMLTTPKAKELGSKFQITTKQPRNLKKLVAGVSKARARNIQDPCCFKCNYCRVSCPVMKESKTFKSTNTKKCYNIKQNIDCDSSFVVYLVTCTRCQGQYVGKSVTAFKKRHSNHKQEIKTPDVMGYDGY